MLIILHCQTDGKEMLVNIDQISYARNATTGGTFIQFEGGGDNWYIVTESLQDIMRCVPWDQGELNMLERLRTFNYIRHHKSGKPFSTLQKLNLFYNAQRRQVLCMRGMMTKLGIDNPTIKSQCYDALRMIGAIEDALKNEYTQDHEALVKHTVPVTEVEHEQ